jgi:hypothetical protein
MAECKVYGHNPRSGPGMLTALATLDDINEEHPTWNVELKYDAGITTAVYSSNVATQAELFEVLKDHFKDFLVS